MKSESESVCERDMCLNCHAQFISFARALSCSGCGVVRFCNAEHQKMASRGTGSVFVCVCV
jgi:hypothetical protein